MTGRAPASGRRWPRNLFDAAVLLFGGLSGATLLALLNVPAGALIGAVLGSMAVNKLADSVAARRRAFRSARIRRLPASVRITGQVLLGVMAGVRLDEQTLQLLARSSIPVVITVVGILSLTMLLARYLFVRHHVDALTAVMAAAPGGISELAVSAQRQGAVMHVVLAFHLFRVLLVVLAVLPILVLLLRPL